MKKVPQIFPLLMPAPYSFLSKLLKKWSGWRDLNSRPLTPEARNHFYNTFKLSVYKYLVFSFIDIRHHSWVKLPVISPSQGGML